MGSHLQLMLTSPSRKQHFCRPFHYTSLVPSQPCTRERLIPYPGATRGEDYRTTKAVSNRNEFSLHDYLLFSFPHPPILSSHPISHISLTGEGKKHIEENDVSSGLACSEQSLSCCQVLSSLCLSLLFLSIKMQYPSSSRKFPCSTRCT